MYLMLLPMLMAGEPGQGFADRVQPLLQANCVKCHRAEKARAGLDLTSAERLLAGAKAGPIVMAGKPESSLLVQVLAAGHDTHMPPEAQLSQSEIDAIASWVKSLPAASVAPRKEMQVTAKDRDFWAFRAIAPISPKVNLTVQHSIDALIQIKLKDIGLAPAPEADRPTLIRRVTFDLIGLPPTPEEIKAFVDDRSPDAYERLIDRLLASPHYGERWARHWLDLARFADADPPEGPTGGERGGEAYHYRDYVIRSLNADKPFDRFLTEQVAGDELAPNDRDAKIATAFLRLSPPSGAPGEKARLDDLDDALATTSAVFMGLTVGCARCHDHKTDPIPQRDYYRLLAVFAAIERTNTPVPSPTEEAAAREANAARDKEIAELRQRIESLQEYEKELRDEDEIPPRDFVGPPSASRWYRARVADAAKLQTRLTMLEGEQMRVPLALTARDSSGVAPVMHLLLRGDPSAKSDEVTPGVLNVLSNDTLAFPKPDDDTGTSGRRLTLARWMTRPDHPLTARVIVNRLWHYHFGRGIVATPSNFGPGGDRPTHPELLDWLAHRFVQDGWSLKRMHRLMLTSATYRQSSGVSAMANEKDPNNQWWSRYPRRRLEAEAIRDAILYTSGRLNPVMYGPGGRARPGDVSLAPEAARSALAVREGPQQSRRSVYLHVNRANPMVLLESFDAPPPACPCEKRNETNVPPQALLLLNGPFVLEQAGHLAARVRREAGSDVNSQVDRLFRMTMGRPPHPNELERARKFLAEPALKARVPNSRTGPDPLAELAHVIYNLNEFIYLD